MTLLETLIRQQVSTSLVATLNRTTDRIAETLAAELLADPVFKERMKTLIGRAFDRALGELSEEGR